MRGILIASCVLMGVIANSGADVPTKKETNISLSAKITNQGRSIQIADDGAFINIPIGVDSKELRLATRIVSRPVDQHLIGIVVETRHGETDEYSYQIIVARRPRCDHQVWRDSQAREIRGKGPRFSKITFDNPVSDDLEVLLESDPKSDQNLLKPIRYTNGCARAWLLF